LNPNVGWSWIRVLLSPQLLDCVSLHYSFTVRYKNKTSASSVLSLLT